MLNWIRLYLSRRSMLRRRMRELERNGLHATLPGLRYGTRKERNRYSSL